MADKMIRCPNCSFEGLSKRLVKGSFIVEAGLYFLGLFGLLVFLPAGLLLLVAVVYSIWRASSQKDGCPQCDWAHVVKISAVSNKKPTSEQERYSV